MSDCTLTLDLGYGPDIEFDGQKVMVGRFVPGDDGAVWVTTQRAPVVLTPSPFVTVDLEQGVYYWFRHPDNSLHVKLMPTSATASYRLLDDIDPDTLDPNPPLTPAWGRVDTIVEGANVTVDSTDPRNPIVSATGGGGGGGAVDSVNSKTGAVVLNPDDLVDTSTAHKFVTAGEKTKLGNLSGTNTGDQDLSGLVPNTRTVNGHALTTSVTVTKGDVGLGSADDTADSAKPVSIAQAAADAAIGSAAAADATAKVATETTRATTAEGTLTSGVAASEKTANKNANNGYAGLDSGGLIPASLLPSYVDDVLEFANLAAFPVTGATGKIYVALDTNKTYRWSGSVYVEISASPGSTDALAEGSVNLYYTQARADARVAAGITGKADASALATEVTNRTSGDTAAIATAAADATTKANAAQSASQPLDSDLTDIAAETATTDNVLQSVGGHWKSRTMAQLRAVLALVKGDVGLGNVDNTSDNTKNAATVTLTNKRITKRVSTAASTSTLTPDSDSYDVVLLTAQAAALTIAAPTGTPTSGQPLIIRIIDNATARALTWNAAYRVIGVTLPTTTVVSKTVYVGAMWNSDASKWDVIAVAQEA